MSRVYNFSAGPAMIPEAVLKQAKEEMLDFAGTGSSVMELSHRSKEFIAVAEQAEADLREVMSIPSNYKVLFLQGGASSQFAMVPINLLNGAKKADYFLTGQWSKKAVAEAKRYCDVNLVTDNSENEFTTIADSSEWDFSDDAAYVHYTPNETIVGLEFDSIPVTDKPLIADFSSSILSREIDVSKFGVIYAGAQKNIGPAGLTIVIVREDLIGNAMPNMPAMLDYKTHADNDSMYNTPPTNSWYLSGLVFKWIKDNGGVKAIQEINERKASKLYSAIDNSAFYSNPIDKKYRSWMNVPFILADDGLDKLFIEQAKENGLTTLKGHRSLGGMRASIYNAMPEAGVDALVDFMADFEKNNA